MKTHWKKLINPDYLGAYSLGELTEINVTIDLVVREVVKGVGGKSEECTVAYIKGQKPMILNNTNCKSLSKVAKSSFIEDWVGLNITVYKTLINAFGEKNVECLRIREVTPSKEELTPKHPRWDGALKSIKSNNTTIEQIESVFIVSPENKKILCSK